MYFVLTFCLQQQIIYDVETYVDDEAYTATLSYTASEARPIHNF